MANLVMLYGKNLNAVRRAGLLAAGNVTVSDEDSSYPKARIWDDIPGRAFKFSTHTTPRVKVDGNVIQNGNLESWASSSNANNWTESGTVAQNSTSPHGGTYDAKLTGSTSSLTQYATVRPGEPYRLDLWAKVVTGNTAAVFVNCEQTGLWLQSDGSWGSFAACLTTTSTSYTNLTLNFTVQSYATLMTEEPRLLVYLYHNSGSGDVFFDDVALYPGLDFSSIHGHNVTPSWTAKLQSSDDGSSFTDRATFTKSQSTFWTRLGSTIYARYWRLDLSGGNTSVAKMWIGEWVLGYAKTMTTLYDNSNEAIRRQLQLRVPTMAGPHVYKLHDTATRTLRLPFHLVSSTDRGEMLEAIERSALGNYPLVIVPLDTEAPVIHGRVPEEYRETRLLVAETESEMLIEESPFPTGM